MGDKEIPAHFIHEIKTERYDVIGVSIFLRKLIKFLRKKKTCFWGALSYSPLRP